MIIGISGKIGSGKDTVGKIIQFLTLDDNVFSKTNADILADLKHNGYCANKSNWKIKKFAEKLKTIGSILTGIPVEKFEDQEFKKTNLPNDWDVYVTMSKHSNLELQVNNYPSTFLIKEEAEKVAKEFGLRAVLKKMTVRDFLQKLGTEAMRDRLHTNVWVNALFADYTLNQVWKTAKELNSQVASSVEEYPNWIITDMRFPNEMEAVKSREGITIRVNRVTFREQTTEFGKLSTIVQPEVDKLLGIEEHPSETALDDAEFDFVIDNDGSIEDLIEKVRQILIEIKVL